jgi:hypothetical protein
VTSAAPSPQDDLDDEGLAKVREMVLRLLYESRTFARMASWQRACVRIRPEGNDVVHRMAFANELAADGLSDASRECAHRRVGPGDVLAYVLQDDLEGAFAHFVVVPLARRGSRR